MSILFASSSARLPFAYNTVASSRLWFRLLSQSIHSAEVSEALAGRTKVLSLAMVSMLPGDPFPHRLPFLVLMVTLGCRELPFLPAQDWPVPIGLGINLL